MRVEKRKRINPKLLLVVITMVMISGIAMLLSALGGAGTGFEPEDGSLSGAATVITNTLASGGKAVMFKSTPTPSPAPTPTPTSSPTVLHVAAVGDIQPPSTSLNSPATAAEAAKADFILGLGDYQYELGAMSDFNAYFDKSWGPNLYKLYPVFGAQHDRAWQDADPLKYLNGGGAHGYKVPVTLKPVTGYSFNKGSWHFIVLPDACWTVSTGCNMSAIATWIDADLKANAGKCTIAVTHQAYFTSTTTIHTPFTKLKPWIDILYKNHVDIYLAGWNHVYDRFRLQNPSNVADPAGLQAFVVGTGGVGHYAFTGSAPANSAVRNDNTYGVLNFTLTDGAYSWKFQPVRGGTFTDSGSGTCR